MHGGGGFYPDHPLPLFIRKRGPVLEEAFILWLFVLSRERSAIFPPRAHRRRTRRAHRGGENKNEKLDPCGENDFLPARLAFFHTASPGPINTGNHRFSLLSMLIYIYKHDDVMRPKSRRGFFSFFLFLFYSIFFPFATLKNQFDEIFRLPCTLYTTSHQYTLIGCIKNVLFLCRFAEKCFWKTNISPLLAIHLTT